MSVITDMLVSALLGGAGVKLVELLVSWRKENSAATVAEEASHRSRVKEYADLEAGLRKELRSENEALRERMRLIDGLSADGTGKVKALTEGATKAPEIAVVVDVAIDLRVQNAELRRTSKALAESQSLMAQTIVSLKAEVEALRKPPKR